jgi:hypothetical protein
MQNRSIALPLTLKTVAAGPAAKLGKGSWSHESLIAKRFFLPLI